MVYSILTKREIGAFMQTESIWQKIAKRKPSASLQESISCKTCVIGGGLAGVLTAYFLTQAGVDTVLMEASSIGSGQTKNTTAKITAQHGLKYAHLVHEFGIEAAKQYASLNQEAILDYENIITKHHIACDFERCNSYLYTLEEEQRVKAEYHAAKDAGLPTYLTDETPLPFGVKLAMVFTDQAQFHPLKFLYALADEIKVYENSRVITVEDHAVKTEHGEIRAEHIVFATHYPFINVPGFYFAKQHQARSYALALAHAPMLDGMFFSADQNGFSFRNYQDFLLLGGGAHRTGENEEGGRYALLAEKAKAWFPGCSITACWSAQDCMPVGAVPYIGRYAKSRPYWYVATGFGKWGMTSSMCAARVITGLILEKQEERGAVFDVSRAKLSLVDDYAEEGFEAVKNLSKELFQIPETYTNDLKKGESGVFISNGIKAGVYRDEQGDLFAIDTKCPHMGCQLTWNADEKSWDCPCHGSRFTYKGELIDGPAQTDLLSAQTRETHE
ncbi:MAG: FAD-dependent oxidoreductase [Clostridiales bacterium]|nr:FAD-dependent oxidoreductase [Clostridiales bacterium]